MKKSELRQIIKEELIKEDNNWVTMMSVKIQHQGSGLYKTIIRSQNDNKIEADITLSDSMPNTMRIFMKELIKVVELAKKLDKKN